ncbi:unknown [Prevotella sp. CAG:5226]|nr:unknown [Prevotella sp. CAG:5226]
MTLCEFVNILVDVEHHSNYNNDSYQENVCGDELANNVAVDTSDERFASLARVCQMVVHTRLMLPVSVLVTNRQHEV